MVPQALTASRRFIKGGVIATLLIGVACNKMPLTAPSGSALTLVASTNVLPVNGATEITAIIIEGAQSAGTGDAGATVSAGVGTPVHDGTLVTFLTTLGKIEPAEARTLRGKVTVKLIADGRSGTATVTAFSGPATNKVEVDIGAAAATRIAVTATPQSIPAGGTSTIAARVEDQQGNGLLGVLVSFSTTQGALANSSVVTNDQGVAANSLTTTVEAVVTATAGGAATALTGSATVKVSAQPGISITPPASAMVAVPAIFTVTGAANPVLSGVVVDFGDGRTLELGGLSGSQAVNHLFRSQGVYDVSARATSVDGNTNTARTSVVVAPLQASGTATPNSSTLPKVNDTVALVVTPQAGAVIRSYDWNFGDGTPAISTASGQTTHAFATVGSKLVTVVVVPVVGDTTTVIIPVDVKP